VYTTSQPQTSERDVHSFPTRRSSDLKSVPIRPPRMIFEKAFRADTICTKLYACLFQLTIDRLSPNRRGMRTELPGSIIPHPQIRSEEHTSELQSHLNLVSRLLLHKKN